MSAVHKTLVTVAAVSALMFGGASAAFADDSASGTTVGVTSGSTYGNSGTGTGNVVQGTSGNVTQGAGNVVNSGEGDVLISYGAWHHAWHHHCFTLLDIL